MFENKPKKSSQRMSTSKVPTILISIVNITSKTNKKIINIKYASI